MSDSRVESVNCHFEGLTYLDPKKLNDTIQVQSNLNLTKTTSN